VFVVRVDFVAIRMRHNRPSIGLVVETHLVSFAGTAFALFSYGSVESVEECRGCQVLRDAECARTRITSLINKALFRERHTTNCNTTNCNINTRGVCVRISWQLCAGWSRALGRRKSPGMPCLARLCRHKMLLCVVRGVVQGVVRGVVQ